MRGVGAGCCQKFDDDNDDNADDGDFDDTLGEILGASFMGTTSLDLDLAFGAVDSNVEMRDRKVHYKATP